MQFNDELVHVVPLVAPVDTTTTTVNTDVIGAKEYEEIQFIIICGAITGDTAVVTVEECDDTTPTNSTAIAFSARESSAVGTDAMGDRTATAAAGYTLAATDDNKILLVDVDPATLTDGYPYLRCVIDPGASMSAFLIAVIAICKPRYPKATQLSAVD